MYEVSQFVESGLPVGVVSNPHSITLHDHICHTIQEVWKLVECSYNRQVTLWLDFSINFIIERMLATISEIF